jgi:D-lactate dehydrogenase
MKVVFFSVKVFEIPFIQNANKNNYRLSLFADRLDLKTVSLAEGHDAVCVFTGDDASADVLKKLHEMGISKINIRAAGYDNIDLKAASELGITITNVPNYSPHGIAEHATMLMLMIARKQKITQWQLMRNDFTMDKVIGSTVQGLTAGILGTGRIGSALAEILYGLGMQLIAHDKIINEKLTKKYGVKYVTPEELFKQADIISIHLPLNDSTRYFVDNKLLKLAKYKAILINTARGAVVKTADILEALENHHLGGYGMDVYEKEAGLFFSNHQKDGIQDKLLSRLMQMENVIVTPHQAFATEESLSTIAETTFHNLYCFEKGLQSENSLHSFLKIPQRQKETA